MAPKSRKAEYIEEVKRLYIGELHSLREISHALGPSIQTLSRWLREEGIELAARPRDPNAGRSPAAQAEINRRIADSQRARIEAGGHHGGRSRTIGRESRECANPACSATFEVPVTSSQQFCGMTCARSISNKRRWEGKRREAICSCGQIFYSPHTKKYCSAECRAKYSKKRQADPENYVTFTCLNCGEEITRYKKYSPSQKYCSNECSAKHNRTRKFYAVEDLEIIFESSYECLFWALCMFWKVPVQRADRALAIPVNGDGWYCPDFRVVIPHLDLDIWVEVKGFEDDDDRSRYSAWRTAGHKLAVADRDLLDSLRDADRDSQFVARLKLAAQEEE